VLNNNFNVEYILRVDEDKDRWKKYTLSKWEGKQFPTDVYKISLQGTYWYCNCLSMKKECKHIRCIKEYLYTGILPGDVQKVSEEDFVVLLPTR
jgi:hypothetical protein